MTKTLKGLTQKEATKRLREYGYNEIKELLHISPLQILLKQIKKNFIVYLLFAAALLSFFVGKSITGYTIFVVIIIVIAVGFFQEYKAERAIKALKKIITPISVVIRNGKEVEIPSRKIVPGDIVVLRTGEKIPADCLVLEEKELKVNESTLTGESREIKKFVAKNEENYEKANQIFMGTYVVNGKCIAKVLHTGMNTEFGKIAGMISRAEKELPLQKKVNDLAKYMAFVAIVVSVLTGALMLIRSPSFSYGILVEVLIVVIALSVSAFPEGFPVVLISTLASGAYRMSKKNAIVNRMSIIETLGETTVICADKTGTITKGEMTVKKIFTDNKIISVSGVGYSTEGNLLLNNRKIDVKRDAKQMNVPLNLLLKASVLCNDAKIERRGTDSEYNIKGSPTEASLLIMSAKAGIFREDLKFTRKEEIPFNSERKMMSILSREKRKNYVYSKGAPEILIEKCKFVQRGDKIIKLDKKEKEKILDFNKNFTLKKFRVLAFAYKETPFFDRDHFENDLIFLGLVAMEDPPRAKVKSALLSCEEAGIKVKMITGDNKETAVEIAREIGLPGKVITGEEIDKLTDDELSKIVNKITIFARVRPEHKLRIVKALKQIGETVTMTGDGVNDAPALKEAHIGVAMGINGTDVSKESADLILKDDNFATIVSAVKEGRTIFSNIQKFVTYQLSCNYAELFVVFFGILSGLPLPLLALQILFINIVTDDLPAISLGFNPHPNDIMKTKPRKKSRILNRQLLLLLAIAGTIMGTGTLGVFYITLKTLLAQDIAGDIALATARTVGLLTLIFFEIAGAFNFRSFKTPIYKLPLFTNKYLVYASAASILLTFLIIYSPLNLIFETVPLGIFSILTATLVSSSIIVVFDVLKIMNKKRKFF